MPPRSAFDDDTLRSVLKKLARPPRYSPLDRVVQRAVGARAGELLWELWRTERFDVHAHHDLLALMAAADDCYDARAFAAFVRRAYAWWGRYDVRDVTTTAAQVGRAGTTECLPAWPPAANDLARSVARRFPAEFEAERRALPAELREAATLALVRIGLAPASEVAPTTRALVAARALDVAHQPDYEPLRAALYPDADAYHADLLAASELAEQMQPLALAHLAATTPPAVWVQVLYNVGALSYGPLTASAPAVASRLEDEHDRAVRAAMVACVERLLREPAEVTPFRLDVFAVGLAYVRARAGEPLDPAHDALLVAALRAEPHVTRDVSHGFDDLARRAAFDPDAPPFVRLRAVLAALPAERAEAAMLAALGAGRRPVLTDRLLACFTLAPTPALVDAVFAAMAAWDVAEAHERTDAALAVMVAWGADALPHLARAQARYQDRAGAFFKRLATRIEAVGG